MSILSLLVSYIQSSLVLLYIGITTEIRAVNFSIFLDVLPQFCGTDPASPASILLEETEHMSCHLGVLSVYHLRSHRSTLSKVWEFPYWRGHPSVHSIDSVFHAFLSRPTEN